MDYSLLLLILDNNRVEMKDITKKYTNGEVTIVWQPAKCIHSAICWKGDSGLLSVFDPKERPWIKPEGANTSAIVGQIKKCPSGALTYFMNDTEVNPQVTEPAQAITKIEVKNNGPLLLHGTCVIIDKDGNETLKDNLTAFCRCGHSQNKPFCDGNHRASGFVG